MQQSHRQCRSCLIATATALELIGTAVGAAERGMEFLPLDHGPDGAECRAVLLHAARARDG